MPLPEREEMVRLEEVESDVASPYLPAAKSTPLRRRSRLRHARRALLAVLVLVPLGYVSYRAATFVLTSPRFVVSSAEDTDLTGNQVVSREEVLNALGLPVPAALGKGMNALSFSLPEKRKRIEAIPWVRTATLTRAFPHRLAVHVVERTPVAFVNLGGRLKLVDSEGVILERPEKASYNFPVLSGLTAASDPDDRRRRVALYEQFVGAMAAEAPSSGWLISEVDVADTEDLKALFVQGHTTIWVHYGNKDFEARFQDFLRLLPELRKAGSKIDSIDLRYRDQIVVNPKPGELEDSEAPPGQTHPGLRKE